MPDLRELRVFVAVAEHLSFTRAAEQLHFTQQTVSKTVRDLERELGVELLERTSREVRLTPAGEALLGPGRDALAQAGAAFAAAGAVGRGQTGTVRIGVTPAVGPQERSDVVRALRTTPNRSVALRDVRPGDIVAAFRNRSLDVVLAVASGTADPALDRAELRPMNMGVHVPADHRLAQASSAELVDFDGERLLVASPPGTPYTDLLLERFAAAGATLEPVESGVTGGPQILTDLNRVGAVAAMPASTPSPPDVRRIDIPGFTMPLQLLWPAGRPPHAVTQLRAQLGR